MRPDVVVSIDSWSFSARVHQKLRKLNTGIPQVHYVAPQVWAWKKKRAKTMYKYIDKLLTLLPQEPKYFTPYGMDTTFVGHPVIESNVINGDGHKFRMQYEISKDDKLIAILPGSRHNEVARLLPVFLETAKSLLAENKEFHFVIPTVKTVASSVREMVRGHNLPIAVVETEQERYDAFDAADVAIAASGTVALELAMVDVPHIIAYKVSPISAMIARRLVKIQFVNLSNILLGMEVVPELLQEDCTVPNIKKNTLALLAKGDLYEKQMDGFKKVRHILGLGEQRPSERAAEEIIKVVEGIKNEENS
jgi:lipid-A-disaccharide synthase